MIKEISIQNFKSCADLSLKELGPLVVLVGRNGAGKSNILKSISWATSSATSATTTKPPQYATLFAGQPALTFSIEIESIIYIYTIMFNINFLETEVGLPYSRSVVLNEQVSINKAGEAEKIVFRREGGSIHVADRQSIQLPASAPALTFISSFMTQGDTLRNDTRPLFEYLKKVRYYTLEGAFELEAVTDVIPDEIYQNWLSRYISGSDPSNSVVMRILHMYFAQSDNFNEIRSLLGPDGLGLIEEISVRTQNFEPPVNEHDLFTVEKFHSVYFLPSSTADRNSSGFRFNDLSVGTRRVIEILISLIFDKSSVMLIEHPEDGIHSGLTKKLIGLLKSYADPSQLFLTSHSLLVFDEIDPEDVRLVSMEAGRTVAHPLLADEIKAAHKYISEDGPFSSFLELTHPE